MAKKILMIDDEPDMIMAVRVVLEKEGFEFLEACDGEEGLKKAETETPDLILLDINMPKKDGQKMLREIRSIETAKTIPVILVTAYPIIEFLVEVNDIIDHIIKPFDTDELLFKIKRALNY